MSLLSVAWLAAMLAPGFTATISGGHVKKPDTSAIVDQNAGRPAIPSHRSLLVTATAYNSIRRQTDSHPSIAAWGDSLVPGLRSIAVSRDLLRLGLKPGMTVTIDNQAGEYIILDKMDARWKRRIDIYYGHDLRGALAWGSRSVIIRWADTVDARSKFLGSEKRPKTRMLRPSRRS